jgi:succinate-semialdehyde dehydrogenase/glutarate-semialdehyde dehydrogenase
MEASNDDEALRIANNSRYGLGFSVFGSDEDCGRAVNSAEAGMCFINSITRSDARMPFGGIKESGVGRESAEYGLREFTNIKTVWLKE